MSETIYWDGPDTCDKLNCSKDDKVRKLLQQNGDSVVYYSGVVLKVNRKQKIQKRIMVISDGGLYNLVPKSMQCKRRIALSDIGSILFKSVLDDTFVLQIPREYDYMYESEDKVDIIRIISEQFYKSQGYTLPTHERSDCEDVRSLMRTKKQWRKDGLS